VRSTPSHHPHSDGVDVGSHRIHSNYLFDQQQRLVLEAIAVLRLHRDDLKRLAAEKAGDKDVASPTQVKSCCRHRFYMPVYVRRERETERAG
jgi:hypothetical protein